MVNVLDLRMILEEVNYLECILNVALYAERKCFETLKKEERVERRDKQRPDLS